MKWLLLTLLFIILTLCKGYSQERPKHFDLIETFIKNKQDTAKIYYVDSVLTLDQYQTLEAYLKQKKITRIMPFSDTVTIQLTNYELKYILDELKKSFGKVWDSALFSNSERIEEPKMFTFLTKFIRERIKLNLKNYTYVWSFTKPISIRNGALVLVFIQFLCHDLCGENEWTFYKKEGEGWKRWLLITGAAF